MPARTEITLPSRYQNPRLLAHGGMGDVYRATDGELGRDVAVKVLSPRYAEDGSVRGRFRREALAAARLSSNPNIVTIYDVEEFEGRPMIVMELVPGGSLAERLADGTPVATAQVLDWLDDAASALDAAHAAGIVHRDVKPANLLLDDTGRVKVADFGIASAVGLDSFTQTGTILGTAGYLSPEQARGERATAASDRYAFALVAWELLTRRRPFASETATAEATAHAQRPVPSITRFNPDLPRGYDRIFEKALAKEPAARYRTAQELADELRRTVHGDADDTWPEPATASTVVARRTPRRSWIPSALAATLLVAGGVAAAVLVASGSDGAKTPPPRTIVKTITTTGRTVERTVTAQAPPPPTTEPATLGTTSTSSSSPSSASGVALNDAGYAKMRAGDYAGALPLLEQAVEKLQGTNQTAEAYADYNLAYTRFALGRCTDVLALLDNSQRIQGPRNEITRLQHEARKTC